MIAGPAVDKSDRVTGTFNSVEKIDAVVVVIKTSCFVPDFGSVLYIAICFVPLSC
jgi:hypothetical protein